MHKGASVPTKHATYQIVLPIIYFHHCKGKFRVRVCRFRIGAGMDIKKASNNMNKMLVAQSEQVAQIVRTPARAVACIISFQTAKETKCMQCPSYAIS